jgi:UDP-N-acetylglucosamine--N-acetylmuramyl-(pentapeptide) pyrophosphoryl-undecaprenol N-acetylglucosamine transferase
MSSSNNQRTEPKPRIAIACGGTGGHLFPGLAVAQELLERECAVTLLISPKEIDQQAVKTVVGMEIVTLPGVGLTPGSKAAFGRGFVESFRAARELFRNQPPRAALGFGGFTSAPPILAARCSRVPTFIHESNAIPGRANRFLAWIAGRAFVGFPSTAGRLHSKRVTVTGTPVRPALRLGTMAACRVAVGLDAARPVMLVMGGSQGASGLNEVVTESLPLIARSAPELQWLHLAGSNDVANVKAAYAGLGLKAVVHPFFDRMDLALGAATAAISRAGASSLAELAAVGLPAVLIPYPAATDNHQFYNAREFADTGAARLLEQKHALPQFLSQMVLELAQKPTMREKMQSALARWYAPRAAEQIADAITEVLFAGELSPARARPTPRTSTSHQASSHIV